MAQGNTSTSYAALLKRLYTKDVVADETYTDNPFLALVPKKEDVVGDSYTVPVIYGQAQGRSHTFANAQTTGVISGTSSAAFRNSLISNWADASISSELILQTSNDAGAFLSAAKQVVSGQVKNLSKTLEFEMMGDGVATLAQIAVGSSVSLSTGVLTFTTPQSAFNFEVGMQIVASSTNTGTGSLRTIGSGLTGNYTGAVVGAVDRVNGTITIYNTSGVAVAPNDSTYGVSSALTAGDYLYAVGDKGLGIQSISSWIPYSGPAATGDSFTLNAINRAVDPTRLAGLWYNGQGLDTVQALIQSAAQVAQQGDHITHYFMTHPKFAALSSSLVSKVQITDLRATPGVGFTSIDIVGTNGAIKCIPDRVCPPTSIFGLKLSEWELASVRKAVFSWDLDGNSEGLRQSSDGGLELRFMSYTNLFCHKPSANINILVQAA